MTIDDEPRDPEPAVPETPNVPLDLRDVVGDAGAGIGDRRQIGDLDAEIEHDPTVDAPERVERSHEAIAPQGGTPPDRHPYEPVGDLTQPPSGVTGEPPPTGPIGPSATSGDPEADAPGGGSWGSS